MMHGNAMRRMAVFAVALALALAMPFVLAGCAGSSGLNGTATGWDDAAADNGQTGKTDAGTGTFAGQTATNGTAASGDQPSSAKETDAAGAVEDVGMSADTTLKEGDVSLVTRNYDETFAELSDLIEKHGAKVTDRLDVRGGGWRYVGTMSLEKSKDARKLEMTLRVPNAEVYPFLNELTTVKGVEVEGLRVSASDVSDEIEGLDTAESDAEAKLEDAKAKLAEVQAKRDAGEATDADVKAAEKKVTEREDDLARIRGNSADLDEAVAMSTVNLTLKEQVHPSGTDALSEAIDGSWSAFASNMGLVLAVIVWALPYLLLVAVLFAIVAFARSRMPKKAGKKAGAGPAAIVGAETAPDAMAGGKPSDDGDGGNAE